MSNDATNVINSVGPIVFREWIDAAVLSGEGATTPLPEVRQIVVTPAGEMVGVLQGRSANQILADISWLAPGSVGLAMPQAPAQGFARQQPAGSVLRTLKGRKLAWRVLPPSTVGDGLEWEKPEAIKLVVPNLERQVMGSLKPQHPAWLTAALCCIDEYAQRGENWDGDGGLPPALNAIADAKAFARLIAVRQVEQPEGVYAPTDGEVMFQWKRDGFFLEIGFYGDESISWYAQHAGRAPEYGDDSFDCSRLELPSGLIDALAAIGFKA